jgi:hypothetical protein
MIMNALSNHLNSLEHFMWVCMHMCGEQEVIEAHAFGGFRVC